MFNNSIKRNLVKTIFNPLLLVTALFLNATNASALVFSNLYNFSADNVNDSNPASIVITNNDGANSAGFVLLGDTIYGTAGGGGSNGFGTAFRVNTDGTHFTNLFTFNRGTFDPATVTYPDSTGANPNPGLILISNTLYGTTFSGGVNDAGSVFKINTDGSGFALLHAFNFTDGQGPSAGFALYSNVLYSTAVGGGTNQDGTIFKINLSDLSFATVYEFTNQINPYGGVVVSSNTIYGFGEYGGPSLNGIVYRVGINGGGYRDLFDFDGTNAGSSYATPRLSGNTLFGASFQGGANGGGNVFRINTDGLEYTNLYSFRRQGGANTTGANLYDFSGLLVSGNTIYGTSSVSGIGGGGTVFQMNTDGTGFNVLHSFQGSDGGQPEAVLLSGGTLYGAAVVGIQGISTGVGGIFALVLQPTLTLSLDNNRAILTWNDSSYFLYAAPTLTNSFTEITGATSPYTNSVTGTQEFFRLQAN
jgi:uncharacterized repeat protein (TIGR03803 family)